jgi:hypothetical protein
LVLCSWPCARASRWVEIGARWCIEVRSMVASGAVSLSRSKSTPVDCGIGTL